jgi:hypothetical protein
MSFVYLGMGVYLLVSKNIYLFSDLQRIGIGAILASYGVFRFYRTVKKKRENEDSDE